MLKYEIGKKINFQNLPKPEKIKIIRIKLGIKKIKDDEIAKKKSIL